jgi:hypothetical protein
VNRTTLVSLPGIRSSIQRCFASKRLAGQDLESVLLGVDGKRSFLISNRNARDLSALIIVEWGIRARTIQDTRRNAEIRRHRESSG